MMIVVIKINGQNMQFDNHNNLFWPYTKIFHLWHQPLKDINATLTEGILT